MIVERVGSNAVLQTSDYGIAISMTAALAKPRSATANGFRTKPCERLYFLYFTFPADLR